MRTRTCATRPWRAAGERSSSRDVRNPVRVGLADEQGFPHAGRMDFVDNQLNVATGTIRARAVLENKEGRFTPGLFARVQLLGSAEYDAILIEDRAVGTDQSQNFVLVLGADNKLEYRAVQLGRTFEGLRVVRKGLEPRRNHRDQRTAARAPRHAGHAEDDHDGRKRQRRRRSVRRQLSARVEPLMNISSFFIDRPIFASVISIIIVVAGLVSIPLLPISEYPEIVPPTVVVSGQYPGASPKTIAETVITPLEQQINGVENAIYMNSSSTPDGAFSITVTFRLGTDLDTAQVQTQNRVSQAQTRLPLVVRQIGLVTQKRSPDLTMVVFLTSPDGRYDSLYLRNYAVIQIRDVLARLPGAGDVRVFGSGDYAMRLWLDPGRIAARGMTVEDVLNAVREQNTEVAAGSIGGQPALPGTEFSYIAECARASADRGRVRQRSSSRPARQATSCICATSRRIELGPETYALRSMLDGRASVGIPVFQLPGANALELSDCGAPHDGRARAALSRGRELRGRVRSDRFRAQLHRGRDRNAARGRRAGRAGRGRVPAELARQRRAARRGAGGDHRHARDPAAARVLDQFAHACSGSCSRPASSSTTRSWWSRTSSARWRTASARAAAAHAAMAEVTRPIISIMLVLCAVFVPVAFLSGIEGQFYRQFAITIAASTVISTLNSLTLSPALAALLLQAAARAHRRLPALHRPRARRLLPRSSIACSRCVSDTLRRGRRHDRRPAAGGAGGVRRVADASRGCMFRIVPGGFIPAQDKQYLHRASSSCRTPPRSIAPKRSYARCRRSRCARPASSTRSDFPGLSANGFVSLDNAALMFLPLKDFDERKSADLSAAAIAGTAQRAVQQH